jgi:hypothetical protein
VEPVGGEGRYRVRIRYRSDLAHPRDLVPAVRVLHRAPSGAELVLDVDDVVEAERRTELHLFCHDVIVDTPVLSTGGQRRTAWSG